MRIASNFKDWNNTQQCTYESVKSFYVFSTKQVAQNSENFETQTVTATNEPPSPL